jgi:8-oxo-dGTP diphosphatase
MERPPDTRVPNIARPLTTVDVVIFAIVDARLSVLLVQRPRIEPFPGTWALPGGFIDIARDADLDACATRKLKEKAGISAPYLEQLGSFGDASRDPRGWSATHVYLALIHWPAPGPGTVAEDTGTAQWFTIGNALKMPLAFDHRRILHAAIERLRNKVEYTSLPAFLLPPEFTLTELQRAYELVLDRELEKSAFRTRVLAAGLVEPTRGVREGPNRPAKLYRVRNTRKPVFFTRTFSPRSREASRDG